MPLPAPPFSNRRMQVPRCVHVRRVRTSVEEDLSEDFRIVLNDGIRKAFPLPTGHGPDMVDEDTRLGRALGDKK